MSLVERAIEKLRGTQANDKLGQAGQPVQIGAVVGEPRADRPRDLPTPSRIIHVDREALRDAGYLPEPGQDRRFADHYRQLKRPVIAAAFGPPQSGVNPHVVMMTSALPGDGKTFTSINLALSMARERDISVLLVDADTPKPHVSKIFGVENERGLLDALADEAVDVESLVLPTDLPGLALLPAGKQRDGVTELLASARMRRLVERLCDGRQRRIVLFDSPPLLLSSESRTLVVMAGQVLLVVKSGQTPRQAVMSALEHIPEGRSVSLVVNGGNESFTEYYGYGAYGHAENAK
jgi:protein-tyrosine kinase